MLITNIFYLYAEEVIIKYQFLLYGTWFLHTKPAQILQLTYSFLHKFSYKRTAAQCTIGDLSLTDNMRGIRQNKMDFQIYEYLRHQDCENLGADSFLCSLCMGL